MKRVRNVMFVVLLGLVMFAHEKGLLANINNLCGNWSTYCSCNVTNNYDWTISCDFSSSGDPLGVAMEFCQDAMNTCDQACYSSDYVNTLVSECKWIYGDDPRCDYECWATFANPNYCAFGEESNAECSCSNFNWCIVCVNAGRKSDRSAD